MKLISLYIENFGGLSGYSLDFSRGLTVVNEPNGFGKTTLAEFIRAMFYGFPRNAKTLDKSPRRRYTPWQGGSFGGNLTFELDGKRYRIERTFGATPKGDSFTLIDLDTNTKSDRFSGEIGLELFKLDSDSFERSTYMPQLHDLTSLTTDNIQAKLGDLVEDPGDMGNYDKAVAALKSARSAFIPYRGSGGTVADARNRISAVQEELDRTLAMNTSLAETEASIAEAESRLEEQKSRLESMRSRIRLASEAAATEAVHREHTRLLDTSAGMGLQLEKLNIRYPGGLPGDSEISAIRETATRLAVLEGQTVTTREDLDAVACLEEHRSRFEQGVPTAEELEHYRTMSSEFYALQAEAKNTGLSDAEQLQYEKLLPLYESGALDEKRLEMLDETSRRHTKVKHTLEATVLSETERLKLEKLNRYFAPGLPDMADIQARRKDLARAELLRQDSRKLLAELTALPKISAGWLLILLFCLAAAGIGTGAALVWYRQKTIGLTLLALGGAALIAAAAVLAGKIAAIRKNRRTQQLLQEKIEAADAQAAALEQTCRTFARQYTALSPLSDALHQIQDRREDLAALSAQAEALANRRNTLNGELHTLEQTLTGELGEGDFQRSILSLHLARGQFLDLQSELAEAQKQISLLTGKIAGHREQISAFLQRYYETVPPEQFHSLLSHLQSTCGQYRRAKVRADAWTERKNRHEAELAACQQQLDAFFERFRLSREPDVREQLLRIRDDRRLHAETTAALEKLTAEIACFEAANAQKLAEPIPDVREDPEALRLEESRLTRQLETASEALLSLRQEQRRLREQLERIPELRDRLEHWQDVYAADRKKAETLDDTMDFLEKARQNLQNSYLGPVRSGFRHYMQLLMAEQNGQILLTPDLEVQLERSGQARELGYFSAGQTDTVMLCMRLALVDALFTQVRPIVILDDPFVNLDDRHTAEALSLLKKLAEEKQILYLTCNSSRTIF